jgi:hypothetical protein
MSEGTNFIKEISLLPDDELLAMVQETQKLSGKASDRAGKRGSRGQDQLKRRLEAITRELQARGIGCPPWWANHS